MRKEEDLVENERDLADRNAESGRQHQGEHPAQPRMRPVDAPARQKAQLEQEGDLEGELKHAADENRPGEREHRRIKCSAKNTVATMNATLSSAGVIAGTPKRFHVFRIPADSDTSEMNAMYGKVMRSRETVSANGSGRARSPAP